MKKTIKVVIVTLIIIFIGVRIISEMPFATDINQTITAQIYRDGNATEETAVHMNGTRSNYLFADIQRFRGEFHIESYERTSRMNASVRFITPYDLQSILYFQNATFPSLEIDNDILINKEMTEFGIVFKDGRIIATSDEMYQEYFEKYISKNKYNYLLNCLLW